MNGIFCVAFVSRLTYRKISFPSAICLRHFYVPYMFYVPLNTHVYCCPVCVNVVYNGFNNVASDRTIPFQGRGCMYTEQYTVWIQLTARYKYKVTKAKIFYKGDLRVSWHTYQSIVGISAKVLGRWGHCTSLSYLSAIFMYGFVLYRVARLSSSNDKSS